MHSMINYPSSSTRETPHFKSNTTFPPMRLDPPATQDEREFAIPTSSSRDVCTFLAEFPWQPGNNKKQIIQTNNKNRYGIAWHFSSLFGLFKKTTKEHLGGKANMHTYFPPTSRENFEPTLETWLWGKRGKKKGKREKKLSKRKREISYKAGAHTREEKQKGYFPTPPSHTPPINSF